MCRDTYAIHALSIISFLFGIDKEHNFRSKISYIFNRKYNDVVSLCLYMCVQYFIKKYNAYFTNVLVSTLDIS